MLADAKVGPVLEADGAIGPVRRTRTGAVATSDAHARFQEAVSRGTAYCATTGVAGTAPGTALSTTPPYTLYNPRDSGLDVVVWIATFGYISGTLGAGAIFWGVNNDAAQAIPSGGTELTPINLRVGAARGVARAFQESTLAAAPTALRPFCSLTALLATTAVAPYQIIEYVDGAITINPGCSVSLEGVAAAGSAPVVALAMTWEEVKRPS